MSAESSAVWGASAPETSAACCATVGPARSTAGWYAALLAAGRSWGGCALGTTPDGFLVTGAQWQDRAAAVPSGETAWRPATQSRTRPYQGGPMDFATQLDDLQQRAADAKTSAQAAVSEDRDQLRRRIDQAKADVDQKATDARQDARAVAADARSKW